MLLTNHHRSLKYFPSILSHQNLLKLLIYRYLVTLDFAIALIRLLPPNLIKEISLGSPENLVVNL